MKKLLIIMPLICFFLIPLFYNIETPKINIVAASLTLEEDLKNKTEENLNIFDFSALDNELNKLETSGEFGASSFIEKVKQLINGEYSGDFGSLIKSALKIFISDFKKMVPLLATILALAILSNLLSEFKGKTNKNLGQIVHFVCYMAVIIIICTSISSLINIASSAISSMQSQMEIIFPIILTLMASVGSTVSVGIYQPTLAMLSGIIVNVFNYIVLPVFIISFVISIVGNLSNNVKLNKFSNLLNDIFKWVIGVVFTVFTGVMTIRGISAGSFDSVSIRTTKFAIKNYVPIVGGYLSDGFNLLMASSVLIKNAVGTAGLFLIFISIISPIISILIFKWSLHLLSAFLEPLFDSKISNFLFSTSKAINMLIASILCVALMYIISMGLLMTTGNVYWG